MMTLPSLTHINEATRTDSRSVRECTAHHERALCGEAQGEAPLGRVCETAPQAAPSCTIVRLFRATPTFNPMAQGAENASTFKGLPASENLKLHESLLQEMKKLESDGVLALDKVTRYEFAQPVEDGSSTLRTQRSARFVLQAGSHTYLCTTLSPSRYRAVLEGGQARHP